MVKATTTRRWLIGLGFGVGAGFLIILAGFIALLISVGLLAVAMASARSLALLSGALIGTGATWLVLLVRAQLACDAFDTAPNQGCTAYGVTPFAIASAAVLLAGVMIGLIALIGWRRAGR